MRVEVRARIAAPRGLVWDVLTDWERQPEWMVDARAVEVLTAHREGRGVVVRCPTDLLGVVVTDVLKVVGWDAGYRLAVEHVGGLITGDAAFELADADGATSVTWWEQVDPPFGLLGEVGATVVVAPFVRRTFKRSLLNLKRLCEQRARAGTP